MKIVQVMLNINFQLCGFYVWYVLYVFFILFLVLLFCFEIINNWM